MLMKLVMTDQDVQNNLVRLRSFGGEPGRPVSLNSMRVFNNEGQRIRCRIPPVRWNSQALSDRFVMVVPSLCALVTAQHRSYTLDRG